MVIRAAWRMGLVALVLLLVPMGLLLLEKRNTSDDDGASSNQESGQQESRERSGLDHSPIEVARFRPPEKHVLATLEGRVVDTSGTPIQGVSVAFVAEDLAAGMESASAAISNTDGEFVVPVAASTTGKLSFSKSGFTSQTLYAQAPMGGVMAVMQRSLEVRGTVTDAFGSPIEGARVLHQDTPGKVERFVVTDSAGAFTMKDCPPVIEVAVTASGFAAIWVRRALLDTQDEGWQIVLQAANTTVLDLRNGETGEPIGGAVVELWSYRLARDIHGRPSGIATVLESTTTTSLGQALLTSAPVRKRGGGPGADWFVWVTAKGYAPVWYELSEQLAQDSLSLALYREATLVGRVIDESGKGKAMVSVWAQSETQALCLTDDPSFWTRDRGLILPDAATNPLPRTAPFHALGVAETDSEGFYKIAGVASLSGGAPVRAGVAGGGPTVTALARANQVTRVPDLSWSSSVGRTRLLGIVREEDGTPVSAAQVTFGAYLAYTDPAGQFEFHRPTIQGESFIQVTASGFATQRIARNFAPSELIEITLKRGFLQSFRVIDGHGNALPSAEIFLTEPLAGLSPTDAATRVTRLRVLTDASGCATLLGAPSLFDVTVYYPARTREHMVREEGLRPSRDCHEIRVAGLDSRVRRGPLLVDVIDAQTLAAITAPVRIEIATKSRSRILPALAPPYRIAEAPSGLATLSVFVDGYAPVQQEVRPGTSAVRVYVGKGLEVRGRITGMTDASEHPLKVVLSSASLTRCVVPLDAQGEFYIRGLNHELLHIEVPSRIHVHGRIFEPQAFATRRPVSVVPTGAVTFIEVPVDPCSLLCVRVIGSNSRGIPPIGSSGDIRFRLLEEGGRLVAQYPPTRMLDGFPEIVVPLPAGSYQVEAWTGSTLLASGKGRAGETIDLKLVETLGSTSR